MNRRSSIKICFGDMPKEKWPTTEKAIVTQGRVIPQRFLGGHPYASACSCASSSTTTRGRSGAGAPSRVGSLSRNRASGIPLVPVAGFVTRYKLFIHRQLEEACAHKISRKRVFLYG